MEDGVSHDGAAPARGRWKWLQWGGRVQFFDRPASAVCLGQDIVPRHHTDGRSCVFVYVPQMVYIFFELPHRLAFEHSYYWATGQVSPSNGFICSAFRCSGAPVRVDAFLHHLVSSNVLSVAMQEFINHHTLAMTFRDTGDRLIDMFLFVVSALS